MHRGLRAFVVPRHGIGEEPFIGTSRIHDGKETMASAESVRDLGERLLFDAFLSRDEHGVRCSRKYLDVA